MEEQTYRPALWYIGVFMAATLVLALVVRLLWSGMPVAAIVVAPIGGGLGMFTNLKLTIGPDGLKQFSRSAAWGDLERTQGRYGESLRTLPHVERADALTVFLPMYDRNWRTGRLGQQIEAAAPKLLR